MSRTILVASPAELRAALDSATGGETILLAPGDYGVLSLDARFRFPSQVTITSADPQNPASFSGLNLRDVTNLAFEGLVFDYTYAPGHPIWQRPFNVQGGSGIRFENNEFNGDVARGLSAADDGFGYAIGLSIRNVTGVVIEGNEFHTWHRGLYVDNSDDVVVRGNEVHNIRSDGMNFAAVQRVVIEDNHIHSFRSSPSSGDHPDMIQFWTNGTTRPSTDIVIRNNVLDVGDGDWTQSIFMRNEQVDMGRAGPEMFYRNVLIEGNTIYNSHVHGITVGETAGLVIRSNAVLHADPSVPLGTPVPTVEIPRINVAASSTNVTIEYNATSAITGWSNQSGWTVGMNAFVQGQNPNAPGYYGDVFLTSSLLFQNGRHDFQARPGGMLDQLQAGSSAVLTPASQGLEPAFQVAQDPDNAALRTFDASVSTLDGKPLPEGTQFLWTFGNGLTATGPVVTLPFPDGGLHHVTLTIRLPDGTQAEAAAQVSLSGSSIVSLGEGGFLATAFGAEALVTPVAGGVLALGAPGVAASIGRDHIAPLRSADSFEIDFSLTAAHPRAAGEVFRLHGSFVVSVTSTGELWVELTTQAGLVRLTTTGAGMTAPGTRDVQVRVEDGRLSVTVDGVEVGSATVSGPLSFLAPREITFGHPWGGANFAGTLTEFTLNIDMADYAEARQLRDAGFEAVLSPPPATDIPPAPTPPEAEAPEDAPILPPADDIPPAPTPPEAETPQDTPILPPPPATDIPPAPTEPTGGTSGDGAVFVPPPPPPTSPTPQAPGRGTGGTSGDGAVFVPPPPANTPPQAPGRSTNSTSTDGASLQAPGRSTNSTSTDGTSLAASSPAPTAPQAPARTTSSISADSGSLALDTLNGLAMRFGGDNGLASFGRMRQFEQSDRNGLPGDFARPEAGFGATDMPRVMVMLDSGEDRLQVLVTGRQMPGEQETDFPGLGTGGQAWGWGLGTAASRAFNSDVHSFTLGDRFEFLDGQPQDNLFT